MSHKAIRSTPKTSRDSVQSPSLLQMCVKCGVAFNSKDKHKHTDKYCSSIIENGFVNGEGDQSSSSNHGFIKDGVLLAKLEDGEVREKDLDSVPPNFRSCLLLVHYNVLEALDIKEGSPVSVTLSDGKLLCCVAWPHFLIRQPCSACLLGHLYTENTFIQVRKIKSPKLAKSLHLKSDSSSSRLEYLDLITQLRQSLVNRCFFIGMELEVEYEQSQQKFSCSRASLQEESTIESFSQLSVNESNDTVFYLFSAVSRVMITPDFDVRLSDVGGLDKQIQNLKELIELPLKCSAKVKEIGIYPPRGILVYGVPGTGKTMTMKALISELSSDIFFIRIDGASILSKGFGETEVKIKSLFDLAKEQQPSVVIIDDLDNLCSTRKSNTDQEKRVLSTLLCLMDELPDNVVFIGITNKPESVDPSLRRPGRFDREVEFPVPLAKHRVHILQKVLSKCNHEVAYDAIVDLAENAYSFTGADLMASCREASLLALKENRSSITLENLKCGVKSIKPSAMREIMLEVPKVYWSDIGGMQEVKQKLLRMVVWPLKHPEAFTKLGVVAPKGILMYGPPGCSKTMVGKALATESKLNFIAIKGPELFNKWVGESERAVREVFRKAKQASPAILFFDEIDALAAERGSSSGSSTVGDRVLAQLLTEMDGVEVLDGVIIVAATNRPDIIDQALLRPGRLDSVIYVPLPNEETRKEIFDIRTRSMPLDFEGVADKLAQLTAGYSGAEITAICQEAGLLALEENISADKVCLEHFLKALEVVRPRTSPDKIKFYEEYAEHNKMVK